MCIYSYISSSSYRATSTDLTDPLSPLVLSSITPGRSSRLHPVSAQSCCIYVLNGRPTFAQPCEVVHGSTSLMSSSLLLQQCTACLIRLTIYICRKTDNNDPSGRKDLLTGRHYSVSVLLNHHQYHEG